MIEVYGFVDFESRLGLREVGEVVSRLLFSCTAFSYEEGLRDEISGLSLDDDVFGLTAVLYENGDPSALERLYTLEVMPGTSEGRHRPTSSLGIGEWLAQILSDCDSFKIVKWYPAQ